MRVKRQESRDKIFKIRLKKGDTVMVRAGKYKGRTGRVLATHPSINQATVEGINIVKKHIKPNRDHPQGTVAEITKPIWVSKLSIVNPTTKKPTRVIYGYDKDQRKIRLFKDTQKEIK